MHDNSVIELDTNAFQSNLTFLKKTFGKKVRISSVVKGNAYGHGIEKFVTMAYGCGIDHFSVFDADEALAIKTQLGDKATIMIMGLVTDEALEWAILNGIEFYVFEKKRLEKALKISKKLKKKALLHIEVETGMNRTGFELSEIKSVFQILKKEQNHLLIKGLCTHYAGAESISNYYRVQKQITQYDLFYTLFCKEKLKPEIKHTACSAASMMFPETRMDLVRIGIMQYGLWPSPEVFVQYSNTRKIKIDPLQRVISWKSHVMSTKKVKTGDFIGYGTSFMAKEKMKIAVIPIGYAHGYSRSLSNQGRVLINGKRCIVVGTVNMNMMIVDVSELPDVQKGDEVVLIGTQNELSLSIASFSDYSNQLNYELLTRISKTIPRKIIE